MTSPIKFTYPDGRTEEIRGAVVAAFKAWGRGEANATQQGMVFDFVFKLTNPLGVDPPIMDPRAAGFTAGARWIGITLAQLVGGPDPLILRVHKDRDDRSIDDRET